MSSQWTVTPDVVRVELRYGDAPFWIELKKELTTGEQKRLYAAGFRSWSKTTPGVQEAGEEALRLNIHWDQMVFEKVRTYLVEWSLTDAKDRRLDCHDLDVLRALKPAVFTLIEAAVDAHALTISDQEKKVEMGEMPAPSPPEAIS
ncbi:MAG TPA: hypothetical protein VII92_14630 [Anaerolineae bacterium]